MIKVSNPLTGSSLLKFNPQQIEGKALRASPSAAHKVLESDTDESGRLPRSNRLIRNEVLYLSEPDEIRKCIEKMLPSQTFCLILSNKAAY